MSGHSPIDGLPEELQLHIINYLDATAPSVQKLREEPSLQLTTSPTHTLKDVSLLSKRWRRLALPLLFRYARLRLDAAPRQEWASCAACNGAPLAFCQGRGQEDGSIDSYHTEMVMAAHRACQLSNQAGQSEEGGQHQDEIAYVKRQRLKPSAVLAWVSRLYHGLRDVLKFVQSNDLGCHIQSFVLYTAKMLPEKPDRYPHTAADSSWRYAASAAFWQHLLHAVVPRRIVILAPPTDLACLTNCTIDTIADWAFGDMDYHILELSQGSDTAMQNSGLVAYDKLRPHPNTLPGVAESSIFYLRPWSSISLNEGSFLKAYGTYEYFERGPPSLVASIKICINWLPSASLRSWTYIAIFPFANHMELGALIQQAEVFECQLAPNPQSGILDDPKRTGKAELGDCWQELMTAYTRLVQHLGTYTISRKAAPRLRKLICGDYKIAALRPDFDEIFTTLCLPVWAEYEPGVFTRLQMEL